MHKPKKSQQNTTRLSVARPDSVQLRGRRSPRLIALGVLFIVLGALGAVWLYTANSEHQQLLAMAKDVRRGETVTEADLAVLELPKNLALDALPAERISDLIGQEALSDLPAGAFPRLSQVGSPALLPGQAEVGLRLPLGRIPAEELAHGTPVQVISLADSSPPISASVASVMRLLEDGSSYALDVMVDASKAPQVARLAATDQLVLVTVAES